MSGLVPAFALALALSLGGALVAAGMIWRELKLAPRWRGALYAASAAALAAALLSAGAAAVAAGVAGAVLVICAAIAEIDAREQIIPDLLVLALGALAVLAAAPDGLLTAAIGATITGGVFLAARLGYSHWRKREGLGLGDVKFALVMGALIGAEQALFATAAAAAATIAWLLATARPQLAESGGEFSLVAAPFGVALASITALLFAAKTAGWP